MAAESLLPLALEPIRLGHLRPRGWLRDQLELQANSLSGHLDEFWPDVKDSGWIGGSAEGWERGPYWLDGIVPLAFVLDHPTLKAKVQRWIDYILTHQQPGGWLGPVRDVGSGRADRRALDPWPVTIALKALTQFHDATLDDRIIPGITRYLLRLDQLLNEQRLFEWGRFRWADLVLTIHWLHDHTQEPWLLELAAKVHHQGFDWRSAFENFRYTTKTDKQTLDRFRSSSGGVIYNDDMLATHVVNNAMAIKSAGVWYRQSRNPFDRDAARLLIDTLDRHHGQPTGLFSGDEHLAGRHPSQGCELCAVVEYMFSLEVLASIIAQPWLLDRLEQITFNALPATFSPDMWAHQYVQQPNQILCAVIDDPIYTNNGPDANIFGLEPNFGCCTANLHQGWPKFAANLWMQIPADKGLAALSYAPCSLSTMINGVGVMIEVETDYPFDDAIHIDVRVARPVRFELRLRIPQWADEAEIILYGQSFEPSPGAFHTIDREWSDQTRLTLHLPMRLRVERRTDHSAALHRGPLLFSLPLEEQWKHLRGTPPAADYEVHPLSPWNYAVEINPQRPDASAKIKHVPLDGSPFSPAKAPLRMTLRGRRLPSWTTIHHAAAAPPPAPGSFDAPLEWLTLIPYGCTNLRITEFPIL